MLNLAITLLVAVYTSGLMANNSCQGRLCGELPHYQDNTIWLQTTSPFNESLFVNNTNVEAITIHHSVSKQADEDKFLSRMRGVHRFHKDDKNWAGIAYHFYVFKNGDIIQGRPINYRSDSSLQYFSLSSVDQYYQNSLIVKTPSQEMYASRGTDNENLKGHVTISLDGNYEIDDASWVTHGSARLNKKQKHSLWWLTSCLQQQYQVPYTRLRGHRHNASTLCPGRLVLEYLPMLKDEVEQFHANGCEVLF